MANIPDPLRAQTGAARRYMNLPDSGAGYIVRGVQDVSRSLSGFAQQSTQIAVDKIERDRRANSAVQRINAKTEYERVVRDTLLEYERDPAFVDRDIEDVRRELEEKTAKARDQIMQGVTFHDDGEAEILNAQLAAASTNAESSLLNLHSKRTAERVNNLWIEKGNTLSASLYDDPTPDNLFAAITNLQEMGEEFAPTLGAAKLEAAARDQVAGMIGTTVRSLVDQKRFGEAEALLKGQWVDPGTGKRTSFDSIIGGDGKAALMGDIEKARATELQWAYQDLRVSVARGEAGHAEINAWREKGLLKPSEYGSLISVADKNLADAQEDATRQVMVMAALGGEGRLDPMDKDHKKGVDEFVTNLVSQQGFTELQPQEQNAVLTDVVNRTGILPTGVRSFIRSGMIGGVEAQVQAADLVARLDELPFEATRGIAEKDLAKARLINSMTAAGVSANDAVERSAQLTDPANRTAVQARREAFGELTQFTAEDIADDHFDDLFSWEPTVPERLSASLAAEANGLFQRQFELTGDEDLSKEYAIRQIKKTWGVSSVTGDKELMKYPPEAFYGFDGEDEWMQEQLRNDLQGFDLPEGVRVTVVSDSRTAREASTGRPTYRLMVLDGQYVPIAGTEDLRWAPDPTAVREGREAELMEEAKEKRSFILDRQNLRIQKLVQQEENRRLDEEVNRSVLPAWLFEEGGE